MDQRTIPTQEEEQASTEQFEHVEGKRRRRVWVLLAVLLLLGFATWIGVKQFRKQSAAASKPRQTGPTPVVAAAAHRGDVGMYVTGLGAVTPLYTVNVKARVDGQLMKVDYREGQIVNKGAPIAELDSRPFEVQLTQAEGQLMKDQSALQNALIDLQRYETLLAHNAIAQQIVATQKATVAQDRGVVKIDEGNIANAKLNIAYCHITSPISGRVGLRLVDPGNIVHAADANGLLVITQLQPISVIFTVPEDQLPPVLKRFRAGQHLRVDALERDNTTMLGSGELTTIDNEIDQTTGTVRLRGTFSNKDDALFPNQFVNARLLLEEKRGVVLVPNAAVQRNGSVTFVYLVKPDQTVTVRNVNMGTSNENETEIASGLAPGDVVVTTGVDKLQEGSKVNVQLQNPGGSGQKTTSSQQPADAGRDHKGARKQRSSNQ
ncbi:MAG: efflux transporter, family, subunit [Candidatus Angelobacter sp.]|nr:efflux transporter, family, subunit [Candidatus Angelobacter sp.]